MDESRMIWEQEIYFEFYINRALNDVFTFEADEAMAALYFADENEADRKVKLLVQNFTTRWQIYVIRLLFQSLLHLLLGDKRRVGKINKTQRTWWSFYESN